MKPKLKPPTIPRVKVTTIILCNALFIGGVISQPVIKNYFTTEAQTSAKANYAPKEYGMNELVENAINTQFVDIPPKPTTGEN